MSSTAYFLPAAAHDADLSAWASIIPPSCRVLRSNLFGDMFLLAPDGVLHMFDGAAFPSSVSRHRRKRSGAKFKTTGKVGSSVR
jgi:hypothetical protein